MGDIRIQFECRVINIIDRVELDDGTYCVKTESSGRISGSTDNINITDEEVIELLDIAHARKSFMIELLKMQDRHTRCLSVLDVSGLFDTEEVWVEGTITESYLDMLDNQSEKPIKRNIEEYDTPFEIIER